MEKMILKGITWGHSRGITPLLAASQRFNELYPDTDIHWQKRSLQEFADYPIEKLTEHYDLLVIDHPWVGRAASGKFVLQLDKYLSDEYLADQGANSTGNSHLSYNYNGHQWALAIDAATPVASYRQDLLKKNYTVAPQTWVELLQLARSGKVAVPAIPIDLLMNFYMFCIAHGEEPFSNNRRVVSDTVGNRALATMQDFYSLIDKEMFQLNPIGVAELMSASNQYWYCPFAYCYSNYSRTGFAKYRLDYSDLVSFGGKPLRSTIGGTGLAISSLTNYKLKALAFAEMVGSGKFQSTFYVEHGGQPGHRSAWNSESANTLTHNFFRNILAAMDRGYTRPRYDGYLPFQDIAGEYIHEFLFKGGDPQKVLGQMNLLYQNTSPFALKLEEKL